MRRPFGQLDVVAWRAGGPAHGRRPRPRRGLGRRPAASPAAGTGCAPALTATTNDWSTSRGQQVEHVVLGRARVGAHGAPPAGRRHPRRPTRRRTAAVRAPAAAGRTSRSPQRGSGAARPRPAATAEQRSPFQPTRDLGRAHRPHPRRGELDTQRQPVEPSGRSPRRRRRWHGRAGSPGDTARARCTKSADGVVDGQRRHRPRPARPSTRERFTAGGEHRHGGAVLARSGRPAGPRRRGRARSCPATSSNVRVRGGTRSRSARSTGRERCWMPSAAATAWSIGPRRGGRRARRATRRRRTAPGPGLRPPPRAATSPTPPTPVRVTSGPARSAAPTRSISSTAADETARPPRQVALRAVPSTAPDRGRGSAGTAPAPRRRARRPARRRAGRAGRGRRPARRPAARCVQRAHERDRGSLPGRVASRPVPRARAAPRRPDPAPAASAHGPRARRCGARSAARPWRSRTRRRRTRRGPRPATARAPRRGRPAHGRGPPLRRRPARRRRASRTRRRPAWPRPEIRSVARRLVPQRGTRSEDAAQPRDVGPKRGDGTRGHRVPPEGGHQPVGGHDLARSHDQDREQQAWLRTAERDRSVPSSTCNGPRIRKRTCPRRPPLSSFLQSDCNGRDRQ